MADIKIDGLFQFLRMLERVEKPARRRAVLRASFRGSTAPIKKEMRSQIRSQKAKVTGNLAKSIRDKTVTKGDTVIAIVGPRRGKAGVTSPTRYAHLVDKGTRRHVMPKSFFLDKRSLTWKQLSRGVIHPGAKPKPFLNAAADTAQEQIDARWKTQFFKSMTAELLKQRQS